MSGSDAMSAVGGFILIALLVIGCVGLYFAPSIVAFIRKSEKRAGICVLNFFLGWTLLGWVIALVWAASDQPEASWGGTPVAGRPSAASPETNPNTQNYSKASHSQTLLGGAVFVGCVGAALAIAAVSRKNSASSKRPGIVQTTDQTAQPNPSQEAQDDRTTKSNPSPETQDEHELRLIPNIFTGSALADGRNYSVSMIYRYLGQIPPRTENLLVQGIFLEVAGPRTVAITDEQESSAVLLCSMSQDEFEDAQYYYHPGEVVSVHGTYSTASKIPRLTDCWMTAGRGSAVRPPELKDAAGSTVQATAQAANGAGHFGYATYPQGYMVDELCSTQQNHFCYSFHWRPWIKNLEAKVAGEQLNELAGDTVVASPGNRVISWDSEQRVVFDGCRPHACDDTFAYFIVAPTSREMDIIWVRDGNVTYLGPHADLLRNAQFYEWLKNLDHSGSQ